MQIRLTQLVSNSNVTGSDVMVTDVSGPLGYITKQATVDNVAKYITGSIKNLTLDTLSASVSQFSVITASIITASQIIGYTGGGSTPGGPNQSIQFNSGSQLSGSSALVYDYDNNILSGTIAKFTTISSSNFTITGNLLIYQTAALGDNAYILYNSVYDKLVIFPGLYVSGGLTGSTHISSSLFAGTTANFTNLTSSNLQTNTVSTNIFRITGNYDFSNDPDKHVIFVNAALGEVTASIPLAANVPNRQYIFKKVDSTLNGVTIYSALETIDGASSKEILVQYETLTIISDGTGSWFVL